MLEWIVMYLAAGLVLAELCNLSSPMRGVGGVGTYLCILTSWGAVLPVAIVAAMRSKK